MLVVFSSCTHYYYIPAVKNVPLFKEKNEVRAMVAYGGGEYISATDVQAAYSITNHLAVSTNLMFAQGGGRDSVDNGRGQYFDFAVGYFTPIDKHFIFEVFGGVGTCKQTHIYSLYTNQTARLMYSTIFVQPTLGFTVSGFDCALTPGFTKLHFSKVDYNFRNIIDDNGTVLANIARRRTALLFEPCITLRGGWKYLKLQTQFMASYDLSNTQIPIEENRVSIGLQFAFAERFREHKKK